MPDCPRCQAELAESAAFCSGCGARVAAATGTTHTSAGDEAPAERDRALLELGLEAGSTVPGRAAAERGDRVRFLPGTPLGKRYRIVSLLGRGGMGEVYRADDLKLGQPVALKFLPQALQDDPRRLERFLNEARVSLKVTHPNVCRVHDIAESEGQHYIAMEYVDGEDLASLLRRIGRMPEERAVRIARQLCSGLAAAHEQGILHRDLKPSNVMIDGQGRARITDFGLADLVDSIKRDEVLAGTPAYMAPEQRAGEEVTVRSDLYSLGLVLYELFTGRRTFDAETPSELLQQQSDSQPTSPREHVEGLDPAVEKAILGCLEPESARRPDSALAVAALLPGGDPLAAILAAGDTPSPDLVAASGSKGWVHPALGIACVLFIAAAALVVTAIQDRFSVTHYVDASRHPQALVADARELLESLGYETDNTYHAHGYITDFWALRRLHDADDSPRRWEELEELWPPALYFWYRQSRSPLVPEDMEGAVGIGDPPRHGRGMATVWLSTNGEPFGLEVVPERISDRPRDEDPDWAALLSRVGIDLGGFERKEARFAPQFYVDAQAQWQGELAGRPGRAVHVLAGTHRDRLNWLWVRDEPFEEQLTFSGAPPAAQVGLVTLLGGVVLVLVAAGGAALRSVRRGRGDRRSATRLALFVGALLIAEWALGPHVADWDEVFRLGHALAWASLSAVLVWVLYVALEPVIRRQWPEALVSWSRAIRNDWRDPLVGKHMLIGLTAGMGLQLLFYVARPLRLWLGGESPWLGVSLNSWSQVSGLAYAGSLIGWVGGAVAFSLGLLWFQAILHRGIRRRLVAFGVTLALWTVFTVALMSESLYTMPVGLAMACLIVFVFARFGLVATVVMFYTLLGPGNNVPLTLDMSLWWAPTTVITFVVMLGLALWALALCWPRSGAR